MKRGAESKCTQTNKHYYSVIKSTTNKNLRSVLFWLVLGNALCKAWTGPAASYFALCGVCLYEAVVCCSDQGIW